MKTPEIMSLVVEKYLEEHEKLLPEAYPDRCWSFEVGEFFFSMNGTGESMTGGPDDGMQPDIPAFSLGIFRNGWLLGFVDPSGGCMMADFEDDIIDVLKGAIAT